MLMSGTRWTLGWTVLVVAALAWSYAGAQETPSSEPEGEAAPADTETTTDEANLPWWGGRNMLYVEAGYGTNSVDDIDASVYTNQILRANNRFSIEDAETGRFALGWLLPYDRGRFTVVFNGVAEKGYRFDSSGQRVDLVPIPPENTRQAAGLVDWWVLHAEDGRLDTAGFSPFWLQANDANGNGVVEPSEVTYDPYVSISSSAPESFLNRVQTWDALFEREWGGRRYRGRWTAGARYFVYEGNVPVGAWLTVNAPEQRVGFTDGLLARPLVFNLEATGIGPTASLEGQLRFFRDRLVLYGKTRFAFLLQTDEADSGPFAILVQDGAGTALIHVPTRVIRKQDKSAWQLHAEIGARIRIAPGTHLLVSYEKAGYQDSLLLPVAFTVPEFETRIGQGTTTLFNTRDLRISTLNAGISFQF